MSEIEDELVRKTQCCKNLRKVQSCVEREIIT